MNSPAAELEAWFELANDHPAFEPFRENLNHLPRSRFPTIAELQALLPRGTTTAAGHALRFVRPERVPPSNMMAAYETEIAASGRVSTRHDNLHDVCNALVWSVFPMLKAALNQRHMEALPFSTSQGRGPVRDALTLFDECGLILTCRDIQPLTALARHDWTSLFGRCGEAWSRHLQAWNFGHANLEKLAHPYKAMTGHCLLLQVPDEPLTIQAVDQLAADLWRGSDTLRSSKDLCPLPFMGIPGWWLENGSAEQNRDFYDDPEVFRPPRPGRVVPPVFSVAD